MDMSKFQSRFYLKKRLYHLKKDEDTNIEDHLNVFLELISKLTILGEKFEDEDKAILLLSSLPSSYEDLVSTLVAGKETLKVEDVIPVIMDGEHQGSSLKPKADHKNKERYYCHEKDHIQYNCEKKKADMEKESIENSLKDCWIFSTRYPDHICAHRDWFDSYYACHGETVTLVTGQEVEVTGKGNVKIKLHDDSVKTLGDVRYVPSFVTNVISVSRLASLGYKVVMDGGGVEVSKCSVMKGEISDENLYMLVGSALNSKEKIGRQRRSTKGKDKIYWCI